MRHFIAFIIIIFTGLFTAVYWKNNKNIGGDSLPILRIYASTSFIKQWGPGPWLKEKFETDCDCRIEFLDGTDSQILIQRLASEGAGSAADLVLGFDQFDLEMAEKSLRWRDIDTSKYDFMENIRFNLNRSKLVPYDWGVVAFVARQSELKQLPAHFDDLLGVDFKDQIAMQDPRTSSIGLQFLLWLIQVKGEDKAFDYLKKFNNQVRAFGTSWSMSYGMFQKGQVMLALSYASSPIYHYIEEKNKDVLALEFNEGHPAQYEFMGIPENCTNCALAEKFIELVLSKEGQKIIMEKNYMFPVIKGVKEDTPFALIPNYRLLENTEIPKIADRERILKRWSLIRRSE